MGVFHEQHPLAWLAGRRLGEYETELDLRPLRYRQGWHHFSLFLRDRDGRCSSQQAVNGTYVDMPILEGIHSRGGRWVKGWIEIGDYFPVVYFSRPNRPLESLRLSDQGMDHQIFGLLSITVPPGGHLMFAYEVSYESPFHHATLLALTRGVPPVCTAQGDLLFHSGFRWVKDWYLAEGGHEGPRKLWGEKPLDNNEFQAFDLKTFWQLLAFLSRQTSPQDMMTDSAARRRAVAILEKLRIEWPLSVIREEMIHMIHEDSGIVGSEERATRICRYLRRFVKRLGTSDDEVRKRLQDITAACPDHR
jgi:hypothetical protein